MPVNPTINNPQARGGIFGDRVALQAVEETDAGIVVNGARLRATPRPHAAEIQVFPTRQLLTGICCIRIDFIGESGSKYEHNRLAD